MVTYMVAAPIFGPLRAKVTLAADGAGVVPLGLASGASGLATSFESCLLTAVFSESEKRLMGR